MFYQCTPLTDKCHPDVPDKDPVSIDYPGLTVRPRCHCMWMIHAFGDKLCNELCIVFDGLNSRKVDQ